MAVRASLVPVGPRMSMRHCLMVQPYIYRGCGGVRGADWGHSGVGVSSLATGLGRRLTRKRRMFVLPTELSSIGGGIELNSILAALGAVFLVSRAGVLDENFFASLSLFAWGRDDVGHLSSDEEEEEGEKKESTYSRTSKSDRRASLSSVEDVWEEAWRPLREEMQQDHASSSARHEHVDKKPRVWVDAIADVEVAALLRVCMSSIEEYVREMGSLDGGKEMIEGLMWRAAKASASTWLGYVPSILQSSTEFRRAREEGGYQIIRFDSKVAIYYSVLRLMTSTGLQCNPSGVNQSPEIGDIPDSSQSGLVESSISLRSWQLTPKQNTRNDSNTQQLERNPSIVGSELLSVAPTVLQDMVVTVADIVCAVYINDVVKGSPSCIPSATSSSKDEEATQYPVLLEMSLWPSLLHRGMASTRDIQNFTNSLYFYRFLDEYFYQIAAIYEDTLPVFMLKVGGASLICRVNIQMRRANELAQLSGVKYAISLAIEALDFVRPMADKALAWFKTGIAWLLRTVIGNAIGLVIEGMQQSSRTRKNARRKKSKKSSSRTDINIIEPA